MTAPVMVAALLLVVLGMITGLARQRVRDQASESRRLRRRPRLSRYRLPAGWRPR